MHSVRSVFYKSVKRSDIRFPAARFSVHGPAQHATTRILPHTLRLMKRRAEKVAMVTAYDYPTSCIAHGVQLMQLGCEANQGSELNKQESDLGAESSSALPDVLLVGDSVGQVVLGHESTQTVTLQHILHHTAAVSAARMHPGVRKLPLVVADLPFGSFRDTSRAVDAAIQCVQVGGAGAIKMEGAGSHVDRVSAVVSQGVAVMGHIGLLPQSAEAAQGGFRVQGKNAASAAQLLVDAIRLQDAGACSMVLELVPQELADIISHALTVPTIGIGAGAAADGQVLVWHDFMGLNPGHVPRFVKQYTDAGWHMQSALGGFVRDVRSGAFPTAAHSTAAKHTALRELADALTSKLYELPAEHTSEAEALNRSLERAHQLLGAVAEGEGGVSTAGGSRRAVKTASSATQAVAEIKIPLLGPQAASEASGDAPGLRVAIVGSGAVAQLLAGTLGQQPGVQCSLVPTRDKRHGELQQRGCLDVAVNKCMPSTSDGMVRGIQLHPPQTSIGDVDVVLLTCKGQYTQQVLDATVTPILGGSAVPPLLVSVQNGLAPLKAVHALAQARGHAAAACVQSHGALLSSKGVTTHTGVGNAQLGFIGGQPVSDLDAGVAGCLAELLSNCGLADRAQVMSREQTHTAVVKKFAVNCALNGSTAVLNQPNGALLQLGSSGRQLLAQAAKEAILAAQAGAADVVSAADWHQLLSTEGASADAFALSGGWEVARRTAGNTSSTLADVQRGQAGEGLNAWAAAHLPAGQGCVNQQLAAALQCITALRA